MENKPRLRHSQDHATRSEVSAELAADQKALAAATEFDTPEALLRHDASSIPTPPEIAARLSESLADNPPPPPARWWRRLLGG